MDTFEWLPMGGIGVAYHSCNGSQLSIHCIQVSDGHTVYCEIVGGGGGGGSGPLPPAPTPL